MDTVDVPCKDTPVVREAGYMMAEQKQNEPPPLAASQQRASQQRASQQNQPPEHTISFRWAPLVGVTVLLCTLWSVAHFAADGLPWFVTSAFGWALFALFVGCGVAASTRGRGWRRAAVAITAVSAVAMIGLWYWLDLHTALAAQLLMLNTVVLALCARRHWYRLRLAVLTWTMLAMASEWADTFNGSGPMSPVRWCAWAWALFALVTADVMLRVWRADLPRPRRLDPALASTGMAAMFAGTYGLLNADHHAWMGLYAAALGAGALAAAWPVTVRRRWPGLGNAYLAQGIVLISLAAPIQFEATPVTVAWAVWAAVVFAIGFVTRRPVLRRVAFVIIALALGKVFLVDMRQVRAVYRVLSFLALGLALLGGALLYTRRSAAAPPPEAGPVQAAPDTPPPEEGSP